MYRLLLTFGVAVVAVVAMTATQVATAQVAHSAPPTSQSTKATNCFAPWVALGALGDRVAMHPEDLLAPVLWLREQALFGTAEVILQTAIFQTEILEQDNPTATVPIAVF
jgi:hypothetical protein